MTCRPLPALLALVMTALSGCVMPEPVLRLAPMSQTIVWRDGRAAQIKEGKHMHVAAAFEREYMHGNRHLVGFRVEIQNASDGAMLVDPARFYYAVCAVSTVASTEKSQSCQPSRNAVNPEQLLLDLDVEHARHQADTANQEILATTLLFIDLAAATANAASGRHHRTLATLDGAIGAAALGASAEAEGSAEAATYELERANWSSVALRRTTLPPGGGTAGLVFVDRELGAREVVLAVRVGDDVVDFAFQQTQYDARAASAPNPPRMY